MKKNIIITGGELFNKGAQSMTFVTVDEIRKRFPSKKIILLSSVDYKRSEKEKSKYSFNILPISIGIVFELLGGTYRLLWRLKAKKENKQECKPHLLEIKEVFENSDMLIDISGYSLSSQLSSISSIEYLSRIKLAKKYGIKVYLMPQSFGPFSYKGVFKFVINFMIKEYMKYPKVIYTREHEGYNLLNNYYKLNNVRKSYDLVLLNKGIDESSIYNVFPVNHDYKNVRGIAIIPNMRNFDHGDIEQIMLLYDAIVKKIINQGKTVYLLRHSFEDIEACKMIKGRFANNDSVIILTEDMDCIELEGLVQKFDFLIASRYHSIIHAYKNGIPCIALGWANKYHELLETFKQEQYVFDVRNNINIIAIESALNTMLEQYKKEKKTILSTLKKIQTNNVYEVLES